MRSIILETGLIGTCRRNVLHSIYDGQEKGRQWVQPISPEGHRGQFEWRSAVPDKSCLFLMRRKIAGLAPPVISSVSKSTYPILNSGRAHPSTSKRVCIYIFKQSLEYHFLGLGISFSHIIKATGRFGGFCIQKFTVIGHRHGAHE